jgi:surface protein
MKIIFTLCFLIFYTYDCAFGQAFVTRWNSANSGATPATQVRIPASGTNYSINWVEVGNPGNSGSTTGTGTTTITFPSSGIYEISLNAGAGTLYGINFGSTGDENKIISIEQWGSTTWIFGIGFQNCTSLQYNASDNPDLSGTSMLLNLFRNCPLVDGDLSGWNTSNITNIARAFDGASSFNGDISTWDVSNCSDFLYLFAGASSFNQDISGWDVSNVTRFNSCFENASAFNQPIGSWSTNSAELMNTMFWGASSFNQDLSGWDVSSVTSMDWMFFGATDFNGDITNWDLSSCTTMNLMFNDASSFNQDIGGWNTSNVTSLSSVFNGASLFNQDISGWNTGSVTSMRSCFQGATSFNQNINGWNTSSVNDMSNMFDGATNFNQDLNSWDVSSVDDMGFMFYNATNFDGNISSWDVSLNEDFGWMFCNASSFNSVISAWNTSSGTQFSNMFNGASSFNQDIGNWDVSNTTAGFFGMAYMFYNASSFSQDLGSWDISSVTTLFRSFDNCGWNRDNYDATLMGWAATAASKNGSENSTKAVQPGVPVGVAGVSYCTGEASRNDLITNDGWSFSGDSKNCALPVELVEFRAVVHQHYVELIWATISELNNDYFEIERSLDNSSWEPIAQIAGAGNANSLIEYMSIDNDPMSGTSYYRLKQVDINGDFKYSEKITANYNTLPAEKTTIYPNPTSNDIQLIGDFEGSIQIFDHLGRVVSIDPVYSNGACKIDVSHLKEGLYHLSTDNLVQTFVRQ